MDKNLPWVKGLRTDLFQARDWFNKVRELSNIEEEDKEV
jgi:hypothetical protein